MIEKEDLILVRSRDHSYEPAHICRITVVFNKKYKTYSEDVGINPLSEYEEIVTAWVVE